RRGRRRWRRTRTDCPCRGFPSGWPLRTADWLSRAAALRRVVEEALGNAVSSPLGPQAGAPLGAAQSGQQGPVQLPGTGAGHGRRGVVRAGSAASGPDGSRLLLSGNPDGSAKNPREGLIAVT